MHLRFSGARRTTLRCPAGSLDVAVAEGFRLRLMGLVGLEEGELEPLLFPRCRSIHTFGMKTPIDVVWLEYDDGEARALGVLEGLSPRRHARAPGGRRQRVAALELAPGHAAQLGFRAGAAPASP